MLELGQSSVGETVWGLCSVLVESAKSISVKRRIDHWFITFIAVERGKETFNSKTHQSVSHLKQRRFPSQQIPSVSENIIIFSIDSEKLKCIYYIMFTFRISFADNVSFVVSAEIWFREHYRQWICSTSVSVIFWMCLLLEWKVSFPWIWFLNNDYYFRVSYGEGCNVLCVTSTAKTLFRPFFNIC